MDLLAGRRSTTRVGVVVTEAEAAAIRAVFEQEGELSAAIEVRRFVPRHHVQRQGERTCPDDCRLASASSPASQTRPDMPHEIVDAVMAHAIQDDAMFKHPRFAWILMQNRYCLTGSRYRPIGGLTRPLP
jgi:hypothetical protein